MTALRTGRRSSFRGRLSTLLCAVAGLTLVTGSSVGQFLDLDPLPPRPDTHEASVVLDRAQQLRSELDDLRTLAPEDQVVQVVTRALQAHRGLAFTLLVAAGRTPESDHAAACGLQLARLRADIDRVLLGLGAPEPLDGDGQRLGLEELGRMLVRLERFSTRAVMLIESVDIEDEAALDSALSLALDPLLEVLTDLEGSPSGHPWPAAGMSRETPLERCRTGITRLVEPGVADAARTALERITSRLEFPDLRAEAELDCLGLARAIELAEALETARWLSGDRRDRALETLLEGLGRWQAGSGGDRDRARALLAYCAALDALVRATNRLDAVDPASSAMRRSVDEVVSEDVGGLRADELMARTRRIARAVRALDAATLTRRIRLDAPTRELLPARRALDRDYERAEREVFGRLAELVSAGGAMNDPDLAGMIARQVALAEDLELIRKADEWIALAREVAPSSSGRLQSTLVKLFRLLSDTTRRGRAGVALKALDRQFATALDPPFLDRLRAPEPLAIDLAGGRDRELVAAFEDARMKLVVDWSDGAPDGTGSARFELLTGLLQRMESVADVVDSGGPASLTDWGGWLLADSADGIGLDRLKARLKISCEAVLNGDQRAAQAQMERLDEELPLALLGVEIARRLAGARSEDSGSTASDLARIALPPGPDAALVAWRADLLTLARFTHELEHARGTGDRERIEELDDYCAALALLILEELEGDRGGLPDLEPLEVAD